MTQEFMTTAEVIKTLKVTRITVYRWIKQGKLPHYKVGGRLRFDVSDIKKLVGSKQ